MDEYQAHPAVSRSFLWRMLRSPAHAMWYRKHPEPPTSPMRTGSATHCLVFEPHLFPQLFVCSDASRRSHEGRSIHDAYAASGLTVLSTEEHETAQAMARAVRRHPLAARLLEGGHPELSFFWVDSETGIECKIRPDYSREDGIIADLKTCSDASDDVFPRDAWNLGYQLQAAQYLDGLKACGHPASGFVFIAVENTPPYAVRLHTASALFLEGGRLLARRALEALAECLQTGEWPDYPLTINTLQPPKWALTKENAQ